MGLISFSSLAWFLQLFMKRIEEDSIVESRGKVNLLKNIPSEKSRDLLGDGQGILSNYLYFSMQLLHADKGMVLQLERRLNHLVVMESLGFEEGVSKGHVLDIRKLNELRRVLFQGKPTIVNTEMGPFACAPLETPPHVKRVIALRRTTPFTGFDIKIISVIISLSEFIFQNYSDLSEWNEFLQGSMPSLFALLEEKNPELLRHSIRVMKLSKILARNSALPEEDVQRIKIAALLHEQEQMKMYCDSQDVKSKTYGKWVQGRKVILMEDLNIPEEVKWILRHRKDWYDGRGCPMGLKGEEIPIGSRIIAIADAFDEGLMNRKNEYVVLREMMNETKTRFDPSLLEKLYETRHWQGYYKKADKVITIDPHIENSSKNSVFL